MLQMLQMLQMFSSSWTILKQCSVGIESYLSNPSFTYHCTILLCFDDAEVTNDFVVHSWSCPTVPISATGDQRTTSVSLEHSTSQSKRKTLAIASETLFASCVVSASIMSSATTLLSISICLSAFGLQCTRLKPCLTFNKNHFDLTSITASITAGITSTEHVRSDYFVVSAVAL